MCCFAKTLVINTRRSERRATASSVSVSEFRSLAPVTHRDLACQTDRYLSWVAASFSSALCSVYRLGRRVYTSEILSSGHSATPIPGWQLCRWAQIDVDVSTADFHDQLDTAYSAFVMPGLLHVSVVSEFFWSRQLMARPRQDVAARLLGAGGGGGGGRGRGFDRGGGRGGGRGGPPMQGGGGGPIEINPRQLKKLNEILRNAKFTPSHRSVRSFA